MYRQGDILIVPTPRVRKLGAPVPRDERGRIVLALGEATGHAHAIAAPGAGLFASMDAASPDRILRVDKGGATLSHEEHAAIDLPAGDYIVRRQREYAPGEIPRTVAD